MEQISETVFGSPPLISVLEFCKEDAVERVFLEDVARRGLGRLVAVEAEGRIQGLCHVGANIVPAGTGLAALADVVAYGSPRMMVGQEQPVTELWDQVADSLPTPLDDRSGQPVFALEQPPSPGGSGLRRATVDDLNSLVPACAAAYREEVGIDAFERDPYLFRWRTRRQIELGRSWLWLDHGSILFKAEASAWTPSAVQLQQVWVDPLCRGQGIGRAAFADLCCELLETTPCVCLFARPENTAALALYEGTGMVRVAMYRSLIFP